MERAVDAISDACDGFIDAAEAFLRCQSASDGRRTPESDEAKHRFAEKWEMFKEACDRAEDLVVNASRNLAGDLAIFDAKMGDDEAENWRIVETFNADDSTSADADADAAASVSSPSQSSGSRSLEDAAAE